MRVTKVRFEIWREVSLKSFNVKTMTVERAGKTEYEIRFYDINYKTNPRLPKPNGQFLFKTFSSYTNVLLVF